MKFQAVKRLHSHPSHQLAMTVDVIADVQPIGSSKGEKKSKKHRRQEATNGGRYVVRA